ncbi:hypothetical protein KEM54_002527 [Ascosphaera aggregata]|nr:hypothetical protein KEM54_002527 [Ascosphaera aggregata]
MDERNPHGNAPHVRGNSLGHIYDCECAWPYAYARVGKESRSQPVAVSESIGGPGDSPKDPSPPPRYDVISTMQYDSDDCFDDSEFGDDVFQNDYITFFSRYRDDDTPTCSSSSSSLSSCSSRRPSINRDPFGYDLEKGKAELHGKVQSNLEAKYLCYSLSLQFLVVLALVATIYALL